MGYPFEGRPVYLALAPLTHAAGVLCFPIMALGGRVVIMPKPDLGEFLALIERYRVTHTFLPPTLIYMLLEHPRARCADASRSLQCFWYGAAPISADAAGGGAEADRPDGAAVRPDRGADDDLDDGAGGALQPGRHDRAAATVVGGPAGPLVQVGDHGRRGQAAAAGERGEIVVRGSLVMAGYYKNPEATAEARRHGWHHTGDIGYLDEDNFLFIVDRAKDMIITGGFNVYSVEVEQALMQHPSVQDCAVIGLPDDKWGERIVAVVQPRAGATVDAAGADRLSSKQRIGSVKTPKQIEVWPDLPRSKVGKVLKPDIRARLTDR